MDIRQKEGESLKSYIQRFMQAASRAKSVDDEGKMMAITAGVRPQTDLWKSLSKNGVKTTQEFLDRADKYIKLEEALGNEGKSSPDSKKNDSKKDNNSNKKWASSSKENKNKRPQESTSNDNKRPKYLKYEPKFTNYTALVSTRGEMLQATVNDAPYKKPPAIRKDMSRRDTTKFYRFHNDYGHDTNECNHLKDEIEFLI